MRLETSVEARSWKDLGGKELFSPGFSKGTLWEGGEWTGRGRPLRTQQEMLWLDVGRGRGIKGSGWD